MKFYKFDGAGNDFVLLDVREGRMTLDSDQIAAICHRRFGVGADGLMTLADGGEDYDFVMKYYNADGYPASMCGNGGRCIAVFAYLLGLGRREVVSGTTNLLFKADDGVHEATIVSWDKEKQSGVVTLGMRDVATASVRHVLDGYLLDTGVPHYVQRVADIEHFDVVGEGRRLRHHPALGPEGANVNFIQDDPDGSLKVRTYERGVEDETWACGTGVTACAIVTRVQRLVTRGGHFEVDFDTEADAFTHVRLTGPVSYNFSGLWPAGSVSEI